LTTDDQHSFCESAAIEDPEQHPEPLPSTAVAFNGDLEVWHVCPRMRVVVLGQKDLVETSE